MKKILFVIVSVMALSGCYAYRHDPNVPFKQKGTNYKKLHNLGCPENRGYINS